ncbi:MAG: purine-binding chemotaxis protein CheW [Nitrospirae bacterium]|nr:purine-binding chemotaxis protein CheW [Nitrospirota bacterium]
MPLQGGIFGQRSGTPQEGALRKLALFTVGDALCGTDLQGVQEVLSVPSGVTPLPDAPPFVEGVVNLRDQALPLVDLRKRFGLAGEKKSEVGSQESFNSPPSLALPPSRGEESGGGGRSTVRSQESRERRRSERSRVLVCRIAGQLRGLIVDAVTGILRVPAGSVEPPPSLGKQRASYLQGVARQGDRLVLLLDLEQVLTSEERIQLEEALKRSQGSEVRSQKSDVQSPRSGRRRRKAES